MESPENAGVLLAFKTDQITCFVVAQTLRQEVESVQTLLYLGFAVLAEEAVLQAEVWGSSGPEQQMCVLTPLGSCTFCF